MLTWYFHFSGWTLDQKATLFPANIDENLVDSQYESPFSFKGLERSKSQIQTWLETTDLTSPWSDQKQNTERRLSRPKTSSRVCVHLLRFIFLFYLQSYSLRQVDSSTQTLSLPLDFNLADFLEKHGAPVHKASSAEVSQTHSANSSLRRKLFDCSNGSDSEDSGDITVM